MTSDGKPPIDEKEEKSLSTKSRNLSTRRKDNLEPSNQRKLHRLITARYTVYGGLVILTVLSLFAFFSDNDNEALRDGITAVQVIVGIALGFIAGSSIE